MTTHPKLLTMLHTLSEATAKGRAPWTESRFISDMFELPLTEVVIVLQRSFDDGGWNYSITMKKGTARTIEVEEFKEGEEGFDLIRDLYQGAARKARRVDEVIDNVIAELNGTIV